MSYKLYHVDYHIIQTITKPKTITDNVHCAFLNLTESVSHPVSQL